MTQAAFHIFKKFPVIYTFYTKKLLLLSRLNKGRKYDISLVFEINIECDCTKNEEWSQIGTTLLFHQRIPRLLAANAVNTEVSNGLL